MIKKIALVIWNSPMGILPSRGMTNPQFPIQTTGLFGGKIEAGEQPKQAALREIAEELTIQLHPQQLTFLKKFELESQKEHFLFHYPLEEELQKARLTEGQRFQCWQPDEIQSQRLGEQTLVFSYLEMLNWFWQQVR
ncbi:MAG: NUDIX domain-containing protein [Chloroflexota bacterium]